MKNMEEQARLQRCLRVLREAADEVFGSSKKEKKKIEPKPEESEEQANRYQMVRQFNQSQKDKLLDADEEEAVTFDLSRGGADDTFER